MVTGFLVDEKNPFGDYHIVREYHAHAWVEAYIEDKGWTTYDPSPIQISASSTEATTPWVPGLVDFVRVYARSLGPWPLLALLVAVFVGLIRHAH